MSSLVTIAYAANLTKNFRNNHPTAIKGEAFDKDDLMVILSQSTCTGIRIYNGQNDAGEQKQIIVGIDAAGNDLAIDNKIAQNGLPCPTYCSANNPLNS
ncbi:MAG: hypothetical protein HYZ42_07960 [Bacteroidetes bacterium]|nr:hypothetical protein [Bacteroidota bacterium]